MYRLLIIFISFCFFPAFAFATKPKIPTVPLYDQPKKGKVIAQVPVNANLVPIVSKGSWVKVGNRGDGKVGWLDVKRYHKAQTDYYRPNIQSVYINSERGKDGKSTINVIAYRNGKKLTDKEARALYDKMLKQRNNELHWQQENRRHINHMMRLQQQELNELFNHDATGVMPLYMMPGPVLLPQKKSEQKKK